MAADLTRTPAGEIDWQAIHAGLIARFADHEIKTKPGRGGVAMQYIDARAVYDRLDEVVGPGNWSTRYRLLDAQTCCVECTLTIHGGERADVGYPNSPIGTTDRSGKAMEEEPLKAAYSDAVKRAAVQWGIGRFLYGGATTSTAKPAQHTEPRRADPANLDAARQRKEQGSKSTARIAGEAACNKAASIVGKSGPRLLLDCIERLGITAKNSAALSDDDWDRIAAAANELAANHLSFEPPVSDAAPAGTEEETW